MLIIIGKSCSGKNTIVDKLIKDYEYKQFVTYTTRPIRKGEVQGETYHFISEEEFINKIEKDFFEEYRMYHTEFGVWYYGSAISDYFDADDKTVVILTPEGYENLREGIKEKSTVVYIYSNQNTIAKRLSHRGDNKQEAARRIEKDNVDFKNAMNLADKIVYNNLDNDIDEVVNKINNFYEEKIKK